MSSTNPSSDAEATIIAHESGVDEEDAERLAAIGVKVRHLREHGFEEGVSTRLLIYAGQLMDTASRRAAPCDIAIVRTVSDDANVQKAVADIVDVIWP